MTPDNISKLSLSQIKITSEYFHTGFGTNTGDAIKKMKAKELFELTEDPFLFQVIDKKSDQFGDPTSDIYTVVNIGSGGNPFELAFEYGTLKPVAVTSDGSLQFCAPKLLKK